MRVNRAKMVRKYLRFYRLVYGINPPYSVLLDGNFIYAVLKNKINISDRLGTMLQGEEFVLYVLKSSIDELRQIGEKGAAALQFAMQKCTMLDDSSVTGSTPFDKMIGYLVSSSRSSSTTKKRFFVCSQDRELRAVLGSMPGHPLLYLNQVSLVMEPPSQNSVDHNKKIEAEKMALNMEEKAILETLGIAQADAVQPAPVSKERKKRKASEPNPLSKQAASADSKRSKRRKLEKIKR